MIIFNQFLRQGAGILTAVNDSNICTSVIDREPSLTLKWVEHDNSDCVITFDFYTQPRLVLDIFLDISWIV